METNGKNIMKSIVLVMAMIILVLTSALIIGSLIDSTAFQTAVSGTVTNETLSSVTNVSASTFGIISTYSNAVCSLTTIVNATGGEALAAGNYTFTATGCTLILADASTYIGSNLNVTYGYTALAYSIAGVNTTWIGEQFGLFVTALLGFLAVIGVIIAIVWLISYLKPLFSKEGMESLSGN